jgi:hypothetical protein
MEIFLVWLGTFVIVFGALVLGRESRLHRRLRLTDLDWKAVVVFAAIVALIPAFSYEPLTRQSVAIPEGIAEKAVVVTDKTTGSE